MGSMQEIGKRGKPGKRPDPKVPQPSRRKAIFRNHATKEGSGAGLEERCRRIIEQTGNCIFLVEPETKAVTGFNAALERLIGSRPEDLFELEDHDGKSIDNYIGRVLEQGTMFHGRRRYKKADGDTLLMDVTAEKLGTEGEILVIAREAGGFSHDMEQQTGADSLPMVFRGILHDMRNDLTSILGFLGYLELDIQLQEREGLGAMLLACQQLNEKISTLENIFGGMQLMRKPTPIERLVKSHTFAIRRRNLEVEYGMPDDLWPVYVVGSQIGRVFENIFHNSVQAMDERHIVDGRISVLAKNMVLEDPGDYRVEPGKYVQVEIADNAGGIQPGALPKIFDFGFSTKRRGRGIGLAICRLSVQKNGGDILVESIEGSGTTFRIVLPALTAVPLKSRETTGDYQPIK